jgi:hypothetical protein
MPEAPDEQYRLAGRAAVPSAPGTPGRTYVCNTAGHCIDVFADDGEPLFSFGEFGNGERQFNEPSDAAIVFVHPRGRTHGATMPSGHVLVVADRGNHRLQMFDLDGTPLATIDPWVGRSRRVDLDDRSGWPFFRVNPLPQLVLPTTLAWRAPFLSVTGADGEVVAIDLELALLPDARTWLNATPSGAVGDAPGHSLLQSARDRMPNLWAMTSRVLPNLRPVQTTCE